MQRETRTLLVDAKPRKNKEYQGLIPTGTPADVLEHLLMGTFISRKLQPGEAVVILAMQRCGPMYRGARYARYKGI